MPGLVCMSNVKMKDLAVVVLLAFDVLVAVPAGKYPLWTVHNSLFRTELSMAFWIGIISAIGLPVWLVVRLFRESTGHALKTVELIGALGWLVVIGYLILSEFPII